MPKKLFILTILIIIIDLISGFNSQIAPACDLNKCKLPKCQCSSTQIPSNLHRNNTPQFVLFTFDDAVSVSNIDYYDIAFFNRTNIDGCPAAATFFVSHEYTNYYLVSSGAYLHFVLTL